MLWAGENCQNNDKKYSTSFSSRTYFCICYKNNSYKNYENNKNRRFPTLFPILDHSIERFIFYYLQ